MHREPCAEVRHWANVDTQKAEHQAGYQEEGTWEESANVLRWRGAGTGCGAPAAEKQGVVVHWWEPRPVLRVQERQAEPLRAPRVHREPGQCCCPNTPDGHSPASTCIPEFMAAAEGVK